MKVRRNSFWTHSKKLSQLQLFVALDEPFKPAFTSFEFRIIWQNNGLFLDIFASDFGSSFSKLSLDPIDKIFFHLFIWNFSACTTFPLTLLFPSVKIVGRDPVFARNIWEIDPFCFFDQELFYFGTEYTVVVEVVTRTITLAFFLAEITERHLFHLHAVHFHRIKLHITGLQKSVVTKDL